MVDDFLAYKNAIRSYYEAKKTDHASSLIHPTPAKLRDLCILILNESNNATDLKIFKRVFGYEFDSGSLKKIKKEVDKFRPLCSFLKGTTELADVDAADLVALLVGFENRPYQKFINYPQNNYVVKGANLKVTDTATTTITNDVPTEFKPAKSRLTHKTLIFFLVLVSLVTGGYMAKDVCFPEKQCMQWQEDHYKRMDCGISEFGSITPIIALDDEVAQLKRVQLKSDMVFFKYGKPLFYYCKISRDSVEFFNAPGVHPVTGKPLKEITWYMIHKHVK